MEQIKTVVVGRAYQRFFLVEEAHAYLEHKGRRIFLNNRSAHSIGAVCTDKRPRPRGCYTSEQPLDDLVHKHLIEGSGLDGPTWSVAKNINEVGGHAGSLVTFGIPEQAVVRAAQSDGVSLRFLGSEPMPGLHIPHRRGRIVVNERLESGCLRVAPAALLRSLDENTDILVFAGDFSATSLLGKGNGPQRYYVVGYSGEIPLPCPPVGRTRDLILTSHQLRAMARHAGAPLAEDRDSSDRTVHELLALRNSGYLRAFSTTVVLLKSSGGLVVADWTLRCIHQTHVWARDGIRPTRNVTAARFAACWVVYRAWASNGYLRDPVKAAVIRTTQAAAAAIGLHRKDYDLENAHPPDLKGALIGARPKDGRLIGSFALGEQKGERH